MTMQRPTCDLSGKKDPDSPDIPRKQTWAAVLFALLCPTVVTLVYFVWLAKQPGTFQQIAYGAGKLVQFGFPAAWFFAVQKRRVAWRMPGGSEFAEGAGFGLLISGAIFALFHLWLLPAGYFDAALGSIRAKVAGIGIDSAAKYIALSAFYALGHSFLEEYYWRWFVFGELRRLTRLPAAVVISSLGFMAHHVFVLAQFFGYGSPLTWLFSACVAIGGSVWALMYERRGAIFGPWISHLLVDAAIFMVGYDLVRSGF